MKNPMKTTVLGQLMNVKRLTLACVAVAVVLGCSVASVRADDIYPPPWLRGQTNTTYQDWTFAVSSNPLAPDVGQYNPNGIPVATINGGTWSAFYDNHVGVWTLGVADSINFYIPNTPADPTRQKSVWTQVTWEPDNNGIPLVTVDGVASTLQFSSPVGIGSWLQNVYLTELPFNPSAESVVISGTLPGTTFHVGQVVIDTICVVPEPSSLALSAMGAVSLLYVTRKRRLAA